MHQKESRKLSASLLARQLEEGAVTAVELLERCLSRVDSGENKSVFIKITRERAFQEARASDERRARGERLSPWDGIPIVWKDLFDLKGETTTAGSLVYQSVQPATQDAEVVAACRQRGLVSIGKTNLSEFAYSGLGLNPHYGTPSNPCGRDEPRAPGGSSSGSAVAVAAGIAPIGVGTDTAGSVRVPASFCGICGFKASQDRYSDKGCFPLSSSLDSFGGLANSVEDLVQIDSLMRWRAPASTEVADVGTLSFVVPETIVFDNVEPEILARFEELVVHLQNAGASIIRKPFPIFEEVTSLFKTHGTLTVAEAATLHESLLTGERASLMDQRVRERMLTAGNFSVSDYIHLQWARDRLEKEVENDLSGSFLLFPTTAITAPKISDLEASDELFIETNLRALRNTMLGSYLGTPGVSLPIGRGRDDLPVGALISAPKWNDDRVLSAAGAVELVVNQQADL